MISKDLDLVFNHNFHHDLLEVVGASGSEGLDEGVVPSQHLGEDVDHVAVLKSIFSILHPKNF